MMRLLLDTHALLWTLDDPAELRGQARMGLCAVETLSA